MREMIPQVRCDGCGDPLPVDVKSLRASAVATEPQRSVIAYVGELCEPCTKQFCTNLEDLMVSSGLRPDRQLTRRPKRERHPKLEPEHRELEVLPDGRLKCPVPGCGKASKNRGSLSVHLGAFHDTGLKALGYALPPRRRS